MTEETLRSIYMEFREPLFRFGYRMTGSQTIAQDMVQDCFLGLFRDGFDSMRGNMRTYLYGAMRNLARRHHRDAGREYEPTEPTGQTPLEVLISGETAEAVRSAVEALPLLQREALVLFEYEELSLEEISVVVDADLAAVKSRLYRARERLRRALGPVREIAR
jgi:RNA polymerase sigma-70 factor (ECF subfamily)